MQTILIPISAVLMSLSVSVRAQTSIHAEDRNEIQSLAVRYATALGSCDAEGFADLFEPVAGFFASGFRGRVASRARLIALVESERHCLTPNPDRSRGRPGAPNVPAVTLKVDSAGVFGTIDLGAAAQYQDRYVRTPQGWRFASRTVLTQAEMAAGLDAEQMAAIRALSRDVPTGDHYEVGDGGAKRFLSSGVVIRVESDTVGGRVYLDDGSYYDDVYEQAAPGVWRIRSRELVPAAAD